MANIKRLFFGSTCFGRVWRILTLITIFVYPFSYHYRPVYIDGISMEPTYDDGQWSLEQRRRSLGSYWIPERFDVVTVWSEKYDCTLCKRVIGLPGETIEVREGIIFINGNKIYDTFGTGKLELLQRIKPEAVAVWWIADDNIKPTVIAPGYVWIVGDNREESISGHFPVNEIKGKLVLY